MMSALIVFVTVYLLAGIAMAFVLKQTPYAENPLWAMVLLWPLYLLQGI